MIEDGFGNTWSKCERENCGLHVVRPGKVQCDCEFECPTCDGRIEFHLDPIPAWPNIAGYFCPKCGPYGPEE